MTSVFDFKIAIIQVEDDLRYAKNSFYKLLESSGEGEVNINPLPLDGKKCYSEEDTKIYIKNWEDSIDRLDKFWNKLNALKSLLSSKNINKMEGLLSASKGLRENDPLLKYIDKARNNSQHTFRDYLRNSKQGEYVTDAPDGSISIVNGKIRIGGVSNNFMMSELVMFDNHNVILSDLKVCYRGNEKIIPVPDTHLGDSLYPLDRVIPHMVLSKGLIYYSNVFERVKNIWS